MFDFNNIEIKGNNQRLVPEKFVIIYDKLTKPVAISLRNSMNGKYTCAVWDKKTYDANEAKLSSQNYLLILSEEQVETIAFNIYKDIEGIKNFSDWEMALAVNPNITVVDVKTLNAAFSQVNAEQYQTKYNDILRQYDSLVNDCSYKSVNLLKDDDLKVLFNEDRSSRFTVAGKDVSSDALGLSLADWAEKEGIMQSVRELQDAVSTLRAFSAELGNCYNIITTRQDFTENLINVLEEGADKLTLADMNEEAANMLALQTSQQLAINSLSLASQAAQSVLRLF